MGHSQPTELSKNRAEQRIYSTGLFYAVSNMGKTLFWRIVQGCLKRKLQISMLIKLSTID